MTLPAWADPRASGRLLTLCARGEAQHVEYKERLPDQAHDIGKSIAAFASSGGGTILYGVRNDGSVIGLPGAEESEGRDKIYQRLIGAASQVRPPVRPDVSWAFHHGTVVCVVDVAPGFAALYYSNYRPIIRLGTISRPAEPAEVEEIFRGRYAQGENLAPPLPSTRQIAGRLRAVLEKMNEGRSEPLTVADLARGLGLPGPGELEAIMVGQQQPSFAMLDRFCARFAVDSEWIATGRGSPFYSQVEHRSEPLDYLELIDGSPCEFVYAVRSRSPVGEAFLVVESDELKKWILPDVWHVSSQVGGAGSYDLLSLYKLFKHWTSGPNCAYTVIGREVDERLAQSIWNGDTYPGVVCSMPLSHWWDDLTDLEGRWASRKTLIKHYGRSFVDAQDIIRQIQKRA